ncbi:hypothetical protein GQ55_1G123100 [Panicum hallii var. hallii]|uniref:Zinc-finger domain-containing protein n=1 Tax=Panicum hallii var. hallii TaxID=1504633 RepID=A0A2T7F4W2_9POAL|nr:hypothetical protein GQ55_1G123100 [Panicum hallii var. hallii]PUZ75115.1 hypothetical protein GQ55_1G123100 [Panicum hallii var. hallii]
MAASSPEWNNHSGKENVTMPQPQEVMVPVAKNKRKRNSPGTTCHQCRQPTKNFAGACKTVRKKGHCPIRYCGRCLLNRYGEAEVQADWICPKCRGICNCSCCRRKKGEMPTGKLTHAAKVSGCTSVHDLLQKGPDAVAAAQAQRSTSSKQGPIVIPTKKRTTIYRVNNTLVDGRAPLPRDENPNAIVNNIVQPNGSPVPDIAGAQLADEDVTVAPKFFKFL